MQPLFVARHVSVKRPGRTSINLFMARLYAATPLALPCFSSYNGKPVPVDPTACSTIQSKYTSATSRANLFSGYLNFQDEICAADEGDECLLDNRNPTDPLAYTNKCCNQGSISDHCIDVREPNDVVEAFQFAKKTGIRLSQQHWMLLLRKKQLERISRIVGLESKKHLTTKTSFLKVVVLRTQPQCP